MKHNVEITFKNSETMMFENSICGASDSFFVLYMDINPENGEPRETRFYPSDDIKHARKISVPECKKEPISPEEPIRNGLTGRYSSNLWSNAIHPLIQSQEPSIAIGDMDDDEDDDEDDD